MGASLERGAEQRHHEAWIGGVHERVAAALDEQLGHGPLVARVQPHRLVRVAGGRGVLRPGQAVVGDDQLSEATAGRDPGQGRADAARAYQEYPHGADSRLKLGPGRWDQLLYIAVTTDIVVEAHVLC